MSKLVETPVEHTPSGKGPYKGSGTSLYNGEPGLPERTGSGNAVPEVTYDRAAGTLPKGEQH